MVSPTEKRLYTKEEYLFLEEQAKYKSEYRNGEILPMAGGTANHNKISGNFYSHFRFALRGDDYEIFIGDMRLWIPRYNLYTYPDLMIIKGQPIYEDDNTTTVINPLVIVEVLSKSTNNYDKGEKFRYYRSIPQLREYILIDQYSLYIEQYTKTVEQQWLLTEYEQEDATLSLAAIDFQIALRDIYERIDFQSTLT